MDKSKLVVLLDNGHGKNTPGKRSPELKDGSVLYEWSYTREIVKMLAERLASEGISYKLIHPEDEEKTQDLKLRVERANFELDDAISQGKEAIFISIHLNSANSVSKKDSKWSTARGWQVHICKNASKKSLLLGQCLYKEAERLGLKGNRWVSKEKVWRNDYYVLKYTEMPAVLTENLFMDNQEDVKFLLSEEGKSALVSLHLCGIKNYLNSL